MYYEDQGEGPPLVLLHGGTCSIEIPPMGISFFAAHFRVIAIEQMGHGRTADDMERSFHYHDMAGDTIELMHQLEIDSASIFGFSDGGVIGLDMAIHHPERVTKLALTGVNFRTDGLTESGFEWLQTVKPEEWAPTFRESYGRLSPDGPGHWPIVLERLQRMWAVEPSFTSDELRSIKAPTLIIVGDREIVTPEHALEMFRTIPHAQLCVVPNGGHGARPNETILAFLEEAATEEN
jgi:pimeloyl-ACP methyl ester carboxylesterase